MICEKGFDLINRRGSSEKFELGLPAFAKRPGGNLKAFQERGRRGGKERVSRMI
jgi:hypothetical protein